MRLLRKIGRDLSGGRNLELYLTITISVILSILGALNVVQAEVVATVTLATLSLLALSTINNREQITTLQNQIGKLSATVEENVLNNMRASSFFASEKPRFDKDFENAKQIFVVGTTLSRTVREYLGVFERKLKDGASLKFIIIDPKSDAVKQAAIRSYGVKSEDFYQNRIKPTIDLLQILASLPDLRGTTELRLLPYMPSFGLIMVNPDEPDGKIYVEIYQHKSLEQHPTFMVDARRDERWYSFFRQQFDVLWNSARPAESRDGYELNPERTIQNQVPILDNQRR